MSLLLAVATRQAPSPRFPLLTSLSHAPPRFNDELATFLATILRELRKVAWEKTEPLLELRGPLFSVLALFGNPTISGVPAGSGHLDIIGL